MRSRLHPAEQHRALHVARHVQLLGLNGNYAVMISGSPFVITIVCSY